MRTRQIITAAIALAFAVALTTAAVAGTFDSSKPVAKPLTECQQFAQALSTERVAAAHATTPSQVAAALKPFGDVAYRFQSDPAALALLEDVNAVSGAAQRYRESVVEGTPDMVSLAQARVIEARAAADYAGLNCH